MFVIRRVPGGSGKPDGYQLCSTDSTRMVHVLGNFADLLSVGAVLRWLNGAPMGDDERSQVVVVLDGLAERQRREANRRV